MLPGLVNENEDFSTPAPISTNESAKIESEAESKPAIQYHYPQLGTLIDE